METEIPENKNSTFSKMFFGNEYDNLKKLIEDKSEENAEESRRIFADSFLLYIDKVLTPIENLGMKNHKELSFLDKFYIFLKKQNKTMLRFPFSESAYDTPTFNYLASYIIGHKIEDIFHSFFGKNSWGLFELNKESCEAIEKRFAQRGETSQNIVRFIKDNPDYQFAAMNYERKSNYWCKKFLASFTILPEWIWCLVGNIVQEHEYGDEHEIRYGIKQFVGGTKVYCFPSKWGDGYENIIVLGKPRHRRDLIRIIIPRKRVENFRLKQVYDKRVIEEMYCGGWSGWDETEESKKEILSMVEYLSKS